MYYQSFRHIDGVMARFGRRSENLPLVVSRPGTEEVRIWGTLQVVWLANTFRSGPDPVLNPQVLRTRPPVRVIASPQSRA